MSQPSDTQQAGPISQPQYPSETVELVIPATFKYLSMLEACIAEMLAYVKDVEQREIVSHNIQLAVHEICTNIIEHSYEQAQGHERIMVAISLRFSPRRLQVELFDTGRVFDEEIVEEPDLEHGQIHGYGIYLVKNLLDDVRYMRQPKGNYWYLAKNV